MKKAIGRIVIYDENLNPKTISIFNSEFDNVNYSYHLDGREGREKKKVYIKMESEVYSKLVVDYAKKYPNSSTWQEVAEVRKGK